MIVARRSRRQTAVAVILAVIGVLGACGASAPKLPSDASPDAIHKLITGADGSQFLYDISTYHWEPDSSQVAKLFSWIPRDAKSPNVGQKTSAGETAHSIASFLADKSDDLRSGNGIGVVNPELTRTYADILIPYLSAMVGDDAGTSGFPPLDGLEGPLPRTGAAFGVLNTDSTAGSRLADAIEAVSRSYEERFAGLAAADPASAARNTDDLMRAARLLGVASATGLRRADGASFEPGDVVADLRFRIAARTVNGPNVDVPQQYFKSDGALMSPVEVRANSGEFGWEDYTSKLSAYLAKTPALNNSVSQFQREFASAAQ